VQSSTFKQVVDALKEILMDVNLEFDETGMKIVALDNTRVVLVHLKLDADKFENYFCEKKLYVGINILKLHVLIKTIGNKDVLTLFVERNDPNRLGIRIENPEKNVRTNYKLSMLDINVVIPAHHHDAVRGFSGNHLGHALPRRFHRDPQRRKPVVLQL